MYLTLLSIGTITSILGYIYGKPYIVDSYHKFKMLKTLYQNINTVNPNVSKVDIINDSIAIHYNDYGHHQIIYLPYNADKVVDMMLYQVFVILKGGIRKDITQTPGIPYLICAKDLNGIGIEVYNDDKLHKSYSAAEIPYFCE